MKNTNFVVTRYENRNGVSSWRVSGFLHGIRIRKNLKTREEAAAEKAALEVKELQAASGLRAVTTFLSDAQLREAEASYQRLLGQPRSLACYLDYALANYRPPERDVSLDEAMTQYLTAKRAECARSLVSDLHCRTIKWELAKFKKWFPTHTMAQFSAAALLPYLERGSP